jgi:ribonuclease BN (tRNA processing enzyme)
MKLQDLIFGAVPEHVSGVGRILHAPPVVIGKIATATNAGALVLSHLLARSLDRGDETLKHIRTRNGRPVICAGDLTCVDI